MKWLILGENLKVDGNIDSVMLWKFMCQKIFGRKEMKKRDSQFYSGGFSGALFWLADSQWAIRGSD